MSKEGKNMEIDDNIDDRVDPNDSELYQIMNYIFRHKKGKKRENIPHKLENIYLLMNEKLEINNQILDKRLKNIDTSIKKLSNIIEKFVSFIEIKAENNRRHRNSRIDSDDSD